MVKPQTATRVTVASVSGLLNPASAEAPRTSWESAFAARPPITSTTSATMRLGSQRGLESVTGVPHRDGDRCTLHNASTDFVGETKPETAWGGRHEGSVTKVTSPRTSVGLATEAAADDQLDAAGIQRCEKTLEH